MTVDRLNVMFEPDQDVVTLVAIALAQNRTPDPRDVERLGDPISEKTYLRLSQAIWDYHALRRLFRGQPDE